MKHILEKTSYHAVYDDSILDALRYAHTQGFAGVQVAVEAPHLSFEAVEQRERSRIAAFRAERGQSICLHAPDDMTSLFAASRYIREGIFAYFEALLAFAEQLGARMITVHPGPMPTFGTETHPRQALPETDRVAFGRTLDGNLRRLIDLAAGRFVVCIENCGLTPMVRDVVQPYLDRDELSLCWDLAKTYDRQGNLDESLERYLWDNVERVRQVHLHDRGSGQSHRAIGTGSVDFMHFLPRLAAANVLDWCLEVRPRDKAAESLAYLRRLIEEGSSPHCAGDSVYA